jgi:cob(I)alamin adenosyltransferase
MALSGKIYTGQGDQGQTQLLSGETVGKDDTRVKTYGALDELQSHLGMARALIKRETVWTTIIYSIQEDIIVANSELALSPDALSQLGRRLGTEDIGRLEGWIDEFSSMYDLPRHFVVPGQSADSAAMHIARAVCRRCERLIVTLNRATNVHDELLVYFNRLSDLLFVLAWSLEIRSIIEETVRNVVIDFASKRE